MRFLPTDETIAPAGARGGARPHHRPRQQPARARGSLDNVSDDAIVELNIPTGMPIVYELDAGLRPIRSGYLGDADAARKAAEKVAAQTRCRTAPAGGGRLAEGAARTERRKGRCAT